MLVHVEVARLDVLSQLGTMDGNGWCVYSTISSLGTIKLSASSVSSDEIRLVASLAIEIASQAS